MIMPYINQRDLNRLREIARTATMQTAGFCFPHEKVSAPRESFGPVEEMTIDELIKDRTRIWRDSWIVNPLNEMIDRIEGKGPKQ
jgi:hypothetical protein